MFPFPRFLSFTGGWFNLNMIIASIICMCFIYYYMKRRTETPYSFLTILFFAVLCFIFALLGARIFSVAEIFLLNDWNDLPYTFTEYLFVHGGYSFYGGMLLNLLAVFVINRFVKFKMPALDILAMNCCLAYALGRIGCQLSGDGCYGIATTLPWGMYYPFGPAPNILPAHPTPIYETVSNLLLFFFLLKLDKRKSFNGQVAFIYLMAASVLRFSVELIRTNDAVLFGLTSAQVISVCLFLLGASAYYLKVRKIKTKKVMELT